MAEQVLDGSDVDAAFQEMRGKAMAKGVAGGGFGEPGFAHGVFELALHGGFVQMMACDVSGAGMRTEGRGGKDILPGPLA